MVARLVFCGVRLWQSAFLFSTDCSGLEPVRLAYQQRIKHCHGSHSLNDGYSTGQYAWVMATMHVHGDGFSFLVYCLLFHEQGSNRFESYTEIDVFTVADTSLYSTAVVALGFGL